MSKVRGFTRFTPQNRNIIWQLALAAALSLALYLIASAGYYRVGFPLDDSWIHLTYARNLAEFGEWAFQPGKPSAGSTAPLWTALLSLGFFLKLGPYILTYLLGGVLLWGLALFAELTVREMASAYQGRVPWVGLFFIAEWHMVWSAASGMETLLHAILATVVLGALMTGSRRFLTLGLLTGLSIWVRPDGITLLGPVLVYAIAVSGSGQERIRSFVQFFLGLASLIGPYLLFNLILSGTPMPNTFYAKQAEYAIWQARPFSYRFGQLALQFLAGPSVVLLPGVIGWLVLAVRRRDWGTLVSVVWFAGYLFLYIERLPVYQHGRYVMPAMPVYFIWGLAAIANFSNSKLFGQYQWVSTTAWVFATGLLSLSFLLVGAKTYAEDVAIIESEMVLTARWISSNVPPDAIVAAHDIGALGYFDSHNLIDLAGLVSPEVIPFMRDEERVSAFLNDRQADYLVAFPEFYPRLSQNLEIAYKTDSPIAPELGGENMVVYHWR